MSAVPADRLPGLRIEATFRGEKLSLRTEAATEESFEAKAQALAPKYKTEFVEPIQETY
jgi:hypothetical protein